jgi:hypothetical protein
MMSRWGEESHQNLIDCGNHADRLSPTSSRVSRFVTVSTVVYPLSIGLSMSLLETVGLCGYGISILLECVSR